MSVQPQQLFFDLPLAEHASFDNFYVGDNAQLLNSLQQPLTASDYQFIYIWGGMGVGRTHLLQASCQQLLTEQTTASYIPLNLKEVQAMPAALDAMEAVDLLCLDDVDSIAGQAEWEEALFNCYNRIMGIANTRLVVTAAKPPTELAIYLPDLKSRLNAGLCFHLKPLQDDDKLSLLIARAHSRGLLLAEHAADYLVKHYSRNVGDLLNYLQRLDEVSLAQQRKITIPFIKEVLALE